MTKSLIYKEWLKTGKIIVCLAILIAGFTAYDFLALAKNAELQGYEFLWNYAISKNSILVENLICLPVVCGMVLAAAQFTPESHRKCINPCHRLKQSPSCRVTEYAFCQSYSSYKRQHYSYFSIIILSWT